MAKTEKGHGDSQRYFALLAIFNN